MTSRLSGPAGRRASAGPRRQAFRRRMPPLFGSGAVAVLTAPTTVSVSYTGTTTLTFTATTDQPLDGGGRWVEIFEKEPGPGVPDHDPPDVRLGERHDQLRHLRLIVVPPPPRTPRAPSYGSEPRAAAKSTARSFPSRWHPLVARTSFPPRCRCMNFISWFMHSQTALLLRHRRTALRDDQLEQQARPGHQLRHHHRGPAQTSQLEDLEPLQDDERGLTVYIARTLDDIVECIMTTTMTGTATTAPEGDVVTSARARTTALHTPGAVDASWVGRFAHLGVIGGRRPSWVMN